MAEAKPEKPGFLKRLFGAAEPAPQAAPEPVQPEVGAEKLPAELAGADLQPVEAAATEAPKGWWQRLATGLRRTSSSLSESVTGLFTKKKLDAATLEELEDALDPGRSRRRHADAHRRGRAARAASTSEISPDEVQGDPRRRGREDAAAGGAAARRSTPPKSPS